jgi:hypothetical protein
MCHPIRFHFNIYLWVNIKMLLPSCYDAYFARALARLVDARMWSSRGRRVTVYGWGQKFEDFLNLAREDFF